MHAHASPTPFLALVLAGCGVDAAPSTVGEPTPGQLQLDGTDGPDTLAFDLVQVHDGVHGRCADRDGDAVRVETRTNWTELEVDGERFRIDETDVRFMDDEGRPFLVALTGGFQGEDPWDENRFAPKADDHEVTDAMRQRDFALAAACTRVLGRHALGEGTWTDLEAVGGHRTEQHIRSALDTVSPDAAPFVAAAPAAIATILAEGIVPDEDLYEDLDEEADLDPAEDTAVAPPASTTYRHKFHIYSGALSPSNWKEWIFKQVANALYPGAEHSAVKVNSYMGSSLRGIYKIGNHGRKPGETGMTQDCATNHRGRSNKQPYYDCRCDDTVGTAWGTDPGYHVCNDDTLNENTAVYYNNCAFSHSTCGDSGIRPYAPSCF